MLPVRARLLSLLVLLLCSFGAMPAQEDAVKKELAKMEGVWRVVRGEEDGKPSSDYLIEHLQWDIKGDQLLFKGIKPLTDRASKLTIKLDPSTTPRCIDLKIEAGSLKGSVLEGVYEWKGNQLRLCLYVASGDRQRPLEFETRPGSNRVLFLLKREKP